LFGYDYGSGLWESKCGYFGIVATERFQVRTGLKGINLRTNYFLGKKRNHGFTLLLRNALAESVTADRICASFSSRLEYFKDYKVFDIGFLYNVKIWPKKRFSLVLNSGYLFRKVEAIREIRNVISNGTQYPDVEIVRSPITMDHRYAAFDVNLQIRLFKLNRKD